MSGRRTGPPTTTVDLQSVAVSALPAALVAVHRDLAVGQAVRLRLAPRGPSPTWPDPPPAVAGPRPGPRATHGTGWGDEDPTAASGPLPGAADVVLGAGLHAEAVRGSGREVLVDAVRCRSLPDTVAPDLALLVCGLNPSEHAADAGVGFVSASNRFWPAALAAGLVERDRDADAALAGGVGMTDLVKRATPRADALGAEEYAVGVRRLGRLCRWLRPAVVCVVGLAGWRAAVDRRADVGPQATTLGGTPVYVMGSTSGLNAHARLEDLVEHLRGARRLGGA